MNKKFNSGIEHLIRDPFYVFKQLQNTKKYDTFYLPIKSFIRKLNVLRKNNLTHV